MGRSEPISIMSEHRWIFPHLPLPFLDGKAYIYTINDFWIIGSQ